LNSILGIIKPAYVQPLKVNADTETFGTKTVSTYRRMALVTKENKPRVTMLRGKEKMFSIGFKTMYKNESTNPENNNVPIPPFILTPATSWDRIYKDIALKTVFFRIPLTQKA
jgi:hypothetical protein